MGNQFGKRKDSDASQDQASLPLRENRSIADSDLEDNEQKEFIDEKADLKKKKKKSMESSRLKNKRRDDKEVGLDDIEADRKSLLPKKKSNVADGLLKTREKLLKEQSEAVTVYSKEPSGMLMSHDKK